MARPGDTPVAYLLTPVLYALLAIAFLALCYFIIPWVLGMLGIHIPDTILKIVMVILGLMCAIGIVSGRIQTWA